MVKSTVLIAAQRFGLGARPGDLGKIGDARGWLEHQVSASYKAPPETAQLTDSATILAAYVKARKDLLDRIAAILFCVAPVFAGLHVGRQDRCRIGELGRFGRRLVRGAHLVFKPAAGIADLPEVTGTGAQAEALGGNEDSRLNHSSGRRFLAASAATRSGRGR